MDHIDVDHGTYHHGLHDLFTFCIIVTTQNWLSSWDHKHVFGIKELSCSSELVELMSQGSPKTSASHYLDLIQAYGHQRDQALTSLTSFIFHVVVDSAILLL